MFGFIEKIVLKRLFKRIAKEIPVAQDRLEQIWKLHSDEFFENLIEVIKTAITKILKKALEKQENEK